jgi:predicted aminopeptidase
VIGCVSYRGYFEQQKAEEFARTLEQTNDTLVVGVPAYSTLKWFDDPVLSTFSHWPKLSLAQLIFHELAHQQLYIPNDTVFNESFATAVEQVGLDRWLQDTDEPKLKADYQRQRQRQATIHQLLRNTRKQLQQLYASELPTADKRQQKLAIFQQLQDNYQYLRNDWDGYPGYDHWFSTLNNARFAFVDNYHRWVPAFKQVLQQEQQDLAKFYWRCQVISKLPEQQRRKLLDQLAMQYQQSRES